MTPRRSLYRMLEPARHAGRLSALNWAVVALILLSVCCAVLETEPTLAAPHARLFRLAERGFGIFFVLEYLARLWTAAEDRRRGGGWRGRLRWAVSPMAIVDLIAAAPALLPVGYMPMYALRLLRVGRILRVAKLGRFSRAWMLILQAIRARRYELLLTFFAALFVLLISATAMYLVEGEVDPTDFGSIPRSLWWAVVTLTTVGYGDVVPKTTLGKVVAGVTAMIGVGLVAAPTGILAAAFSTATQHERDVVDRARVEDAEVRRLRRGRRACAATPAQPSAREGN